MSKFGVGRTLPGSMQSTTISCPGCGRAIYAEFGRCGKCKPIVAKPAVPAAEKGGKQ